MNSGEQQHGSLNLAEAPAQVESAYAAIVEQVREARETATPVAIIGGGTKHFYGRKIDATPLDTTAYRGVVEYEPAELVITVRAGTKLSELEKVLAADQQMFAFEPPMFGVDSTIGGVVAAGLSGPRRPYAGAVRDAVLGVKILTANGETLSFGGQVMKNVAGYDISRLMTGALGTLGIVLEVSLRVAPLPQAARTLVWPSDLGAAQQRMLALASQPLPITAMAFDGSHLRVRLAGPTAAVDSATDDLNPDSVGGVEFWLELKDQRLAFFDTQEPLWRLSVMPALAPIPIPGETLWDWGGACRWLKSHETASRVRDLIAPSGGHATLFRNNRDSSTFTPLDPVSHKIHQRLKRTFDPIGIFNPGRMYDNI